jgi:hypothetical protein
MSPHAFRRRKNGTTAQRGKVFKVRAEKPGLSETIDGDDADAGPDPRERPCAICGTPTIYHVNDTPCCGSCWDQL